LRVCDEYGVEHSEGAHQEGVSAYALPDDLFLQRLLELPEAAEADIPEAVYLDISSNSPFPLPECCYGWRVVARSEGSIQIAIVMASKAMVHAWLRDLSSELNVEPSESEVWAQIAPGQFAVLQGFGKDVRKQGYFAALRQVAWRSGALLASFLIVCALPGLYADVRAHQIEERALEVREAAGSATRLRERLAEQRNVLDELAVLYEQRMPYHRWLHTLSLLTPDTVHLNRLEIAGRELEISGYADNAADYLTQVAESKKFVDLEASGAFTRDRNTGLERFNISMVLPPQEGVAEEDVGRGDP
jgi:general secretion pathway protein L